MKLTNTLNGNKLQKIFIILIFISAITVVSASEDDMIIYSNTLNTELHQYIIMNNPDGVRDVIKKGADVNAVDKYKITTPLITASENGFYDIVKVLVENGARVNKHVTLGVNALMSASGNGHITTVKYLIENDADVNLAVSYKETALMHAASNGHLEIVKYLIKNDADVNLQNVEGVTALMLASQNDSNIEVIKYLIKNGADVNIRNNNGSTALSWTGSNKIMADYLISKGAVK